MGYFNVKIGQNILYRWTVEKDTKEVMAILHEKLLVMNLLEPDNSTIIVYIFRKKSTN